MTHWDPAAERRAKKAERRAENIRKYAKPGDMAAERRAQKAERRAENIRMYAAEREAQARQRLFVAFDEQKHESEKQAPHVTSDSGSGQEHVFWESTFTAASGQGTSGETAAPRDPPPSSQGTRDASTSSSEKKKAAESETLPCGCNAMLFLVGIAVAFMFWQSHRWVSISLVVVMAIYAAGLMGDEK